MTDREKLIELVDEWAEDANLKHWYSEELDESLADYLISKGVTIPVRCNECKHCEIVNKQPIYAKCKKTGHIFELWKEDIREGFCSYGERKENDKHE